MNSFVRRLACSGGGAVLSLYGWAFFYATIYGAEGPNMEGADAFALQRSVWLVFGSTSSAIASVLSGLCHPRSGNAISVGVVYAPGNWLLLFYTVHWMAGFHDFVQVATAVPWVAVSWVFTSLGIWLGTKVRGGRAMGDLDKLQS